MSIITINNQKAYEVYMEVTMYMHYKTVIICRHTVKSDLSIIRLPHLIPIQTL